MEKDDLEFLAGILEDSNLLFYGELESLLDRFLSKVFLHDLREYGFEKVKMEDDFATAYWLFMSFMCGKADLAEYGTSPRGAWLTPKGERFKKIIMENPAPISQAEDYIHNKYNS